MFFTAVFRLLVRPLGYLAFTMAVAALSLAARLLGDKHELGFFSGRLAQMIARYPAVTRPGVMVAWGVWAGLILLAVSPLSPTRWDEVGLAVAALVVLARQIAGGHRGER
jgi:hypothetical protein